MTAVTQSHGDLLIRRLTTMSVMRMAAARLPRRSLLTAMPTMRITTTTLETTLESYMVARKPA